jgi:DNA helicase-2/ATP-dependent DNA helicase PcrA
MATGTPEEIEEERRLLYVAMTRAKNTLHLLRPLRFFMRQQHRYSDRYVTVPRSRFIPDNILDRFERVTEHDPARPTGDSGVQTGNVSIDIATKLRALWNG